MYEHPWNVRIMYGLTPDILKRLILKMDQPLNLEESKQVLVETLAIEFEDIGINHSMRDLSNFKNLYLK
jgi:hypothetical protein